MVVVDGRAGLVLKAACGDRYTLSATLPEDEERTLGSRSLAKYPQRSSRRNGLRFAQARRRHTAAEGRFSAAQSDTFLKYGERTLCRYLF
jgi:hypothetical protein